MIRWETAGFRLLSNCVSTIANERYVRSHFRQQYGGELRHSWSDYRGSGSGLRIGKIAPRIEPLGNPDVFVSPTNMEYNKTMEKMIDQPPRRLGNTVQLTYDTT